jgi:hypothetical protein
VRIEDGYRLTGSVALTFLIRFLLSPHFAMMRRH